MIILRLALLLAFIFMVKANFPIEPELRDSEPNNIFMRSDAYYRLPETLDPIHYEVEITPYFEATETREQFTFDGIVTITVVAEEDDISIIVLQDNVRNISEVTVTHMDGTIILLDFTNPFERNRPYQFLYINLREGETLVKNETYIIKVTYIGNMNETPLSRGVFRGSYRNKETGVLHWYAATHLQPTHARQAFPSFDEPGFKSVFTIIINRPLNFTDTYSNMPLNRREQNGDRVKEIFLPTPAMSAYLVTFHISEEFKVIADNEDDERSYRILARPDAEGQGDYALEVGVRLTKWLEDYFDIPYYTMGDRMKNDQIASPDWASGATENWGLVTYRELRLLYEAGETNSLDKMYIGTITAHELAHKWFGNLITARWWDNVWVNEGFASYFEYFAMHGEYPELELEDQFNIMYVQNALSADSAANTRALQHTVNSPEEVTGHFSGISYSKGASLLMMLNHFLTPDTFQKSLTSFLLDRRYKYALPEHIYEAFETVVSEDGALEQFPEINITNFLETWVNEPGYPILNVNVDITLGRINLSQERFYISPSAQDTDQVWPLPLTYTIGSNANWEDRKATHVMTEKTDYITHELENEWVIFNIKQSGIYRVNYNTRNWELIASALENNTSAIHPMNRAQIVDDIFALMRSERITYELGFKVLAFLKKETNYFVWYPAISGFNSIRNRLLHLPRVLPEFDKYLFEYLDEVIGDLGYEEGEDEPITRILNRLFTMSFACNVGHQGCVENAVHTFSSYLSNETTSVNPNIRRHVFCHGLLASDYEGWEHMYNRTLSSNNQAAEQVMLRSLGCTTNSDAIQTYLELILSSNVRAQDRVNAFLFLFMGHRNNAKVALDFIKENLDEIRDAVVGAVRSTSIIANLAAYLDEEGLIEMEQWLYVNPTLPEYTTGMNAIIAARNNMEWGTRHADSIIRGLRASGAAILPTTILILAAIVTLLFK